MSDAKSKDCYTFQCLTKIADEVIHDLRPHNYRLHNATNWRSYQYENTRPYRLYIHKISQNGYHVQVNKKCCSRWKIVTNKATACVSASTIGFGKAPEYRMAVNLTGMNRDEIKALFHYALVCEA